MPPPSEFLNSLWPQEGARCTLQPDHWLLFALPLAVVALCGWWAKRGQPWPWRLLMIAVRCALLVGILLIGARLGITRSVSQPGTVLVAIDESRSVDPAAIALRREALARWAARHGHTLRVQPFGHDDEGLVSDPRPALARLAADPAAAQSGNPLLLWSDGRLPPPDSHHASWPGEVRVGPLSVREVSPLAMATATLIMEADRPPLLRWAGEATHATAMRIALRVDDLPPTYIDRDLPGGAFQIETSLPELDPGWHRVALRASSASGETWAEDGAVWRVERPLRVLVVGSDQGLVARALKVQEIPHEVVTEAEVLAAPQLLAQRDVLVFDEADLSRLRGAALDEAIAAHLNAEGGLLVIPSAVRGALYSDAEHPILDRLPLKGLPPPPLPGPELPEPEPNPADEGLSPLDPDEFEEETRTVKTLGMLLLIDASSSMQGMSMLAAKRGAVAAARQLHPLDEIGVVAFSGRAITVLPMGPAGDGQRVEDRVRRIRPNGPTDFRPALIRAIDMLALPRYAIRHAILLSDGEPRKVPLKPLVDDLRANGITLSTVGCGPGMKPKLMSNLAALGGGKFHPAFNPNEVPGVFIVEAQRLIAATGARKPPLDDPSKPPDIAPTDPAEEAAASIPTELDQPDPQAEPVGIRVVWPTGWTAGLAVHEAGGLLDVHPTGWRSRSWPALELSDGRPVAAQGRIHGGKVVAFSGPLEGEWARMLDLWPARPQMIAQLVRALLPPPDSARYTVDVETVGRRLNLQVWDRQRRALEEAVEVVLKDGAGRVIATADREGATNRFRIAPPTKVEAAVVWPTIVRSDGRLVRQRPVPVRLSPPPELEPGPTDPERLESWATALGGNLHALPLRGLEVEARSIEQFHPRFRWLLPWVLGLLLLDFGLYLWRGR